MMRSTLVRVVFVFSLIGGGLGVIARPAAAVNVLGATPVLDAEEQAFVVLLNNYRAARGLNPLQISTALTKAADWFNQDLSVRTDKTDLRHDDSLGRDFVERFADFGYGYNTFTAENVAGGQLTGQQVFDEWVVSPTHEIHMSSPKYTTMGISRFYRPGSYYGWYWTNDFGGVNDAQVTPPTPPAPVEVTPGRSALVPLPPTRILDSRPFSGVGPGGAIDLQVLGKGNVPANASEVAAVVLTVTTTEALGAGFVTAYPFGGGRPTASSLNVEATGTTVANLVTVPVGGGGKVSLYSSGGGQLLADVVGYYRNVASTSSAGRFEPAAPVRVLDTRGKGAVAPKASRVLHMLGANGIPPSGVSAVSLNLTVTSATGPGFLTAYPAASGVPTVSNLNVNTAGDTVAGAAIVPVDSNGNIGVYVDGGGDLLVDINGWFTDGTTPASSKGLFIARTPSRELDTRGQSTFAQHSSRNLAAPATAIAVSANLTLTGTAEAGFLTAYAAGAGLPSVSSLNATHTGHTVANHALVPASGAGIGLYADMQTDLIVDYDGYYLPAGV
jgi:hypothetical protein